MLTTDTSWQEPLQFSDEVERLLAEDDDYMGMGEEDSYLDDVDLDTNDRPSQTTNKGHGSAMPSMPSLADAPPPPGWKSAHVMADVEMQAANASILFDTNNAASIEAAKVLANDQLKNSISEKDLSDLLTPAKSMSNLISGAGMVRRKPGAVRISRAVPDTEPVSKKAADSAQSSNSKAVPGALSAHSKTRWNSTAMRFSVERMDELACTKKGEWSEEDDELLRVKHKECHGCWADIAKVFDGKNDVDVCDRWRRFVSPQARKARERRARQKALDEERLARKEQQIMAKVEAKRKEVVRVKQKEEQSEYDTKCNRFLNSANAALERAKKEVVKNEQDKMKKASDLYERELENLRSDPNMMQVLDPSQSAHASSVPTLKAEADKLQSLLKQKMQAEKPQTSLTDHNPNPMLHIPVLQQQGLGGMGNIGSKSKNQVGSPPQQAQQAVGQAGGQARRRRQKQTGVLGAVCHDDEVPISGADSGSHNVGAQDAAKAAHAAIAAAAAAGPSSSSSSISSGSGVNAARAMQKKQQMQMRNSRSVGGLQAVHQRGQPVSLVSGTSNGKMLRSTSQVVLTKANGPSKSNLQLPITSFSSAHLPNTRSQNPPHQESFEQRKLGYIGMMTKNK